MSGTSRQFQAVITVNDRTAAPLAMIAARLRAIAGMSGMERIRASALGVQRSFAGMAASVARVGAVAGVVGVAAGAGLAAMVRGAADATGELDDLGKRLGISTQDLQAFRFAAVASGQSGETFTAAMVRLNRGMAEAAAGGNQDLASLFRRLGINLRGANGQIRSAAEVMPQLAQAFMRNENAAVRTRMAMVAFGRSGEALLPMFTDGAEGLAKLTEMFRQYGYSFSDEEIARGAAFGDTMDSFMVAVRGTADAIGSQLIPVVGPLLESLRDWIAANRELIAGQIGQWARDLSDWIKGLDFQRIVTETRGFITAANELFERIGGWKTAGIAVAAYFTGPFVASLAVLALAITTTLIPPLVRAVALMTRLGAARLPAAAASLAPAAAAAAPAAAAAAPAAAAAAPAAAAPMVAAAGAAASAAVAAAGLAAAGLAVAQVITAAEDPEIRRQSRERLDAGANGARRIEGFDTPDDGEAAPPRASWLSRLPSLFGRQQDQRSAAEPARGQVDVRMRFENVPPGARVDAQASGAGVRQPDLDVGYATMGAY